MFLVVTVDLNAEPHRLLGDNGAFIWSSAYECLHGSSPIDDGEKLLISWSEQRAEDGVRQVYYQIINRDGSHDFETPQLLSDPDLYTTYGSSAVDEDGFYYVNWMATSPDDSLTTTVYAQKFDSQGRPIWGNQPRVLYTARINLEQECNSWNGRHNWEFTIPVEGGCYYISRFGYFLITNEGVLDEDWPYFNNRIGQGTTLSHAISDGAGGFWVYAYQHSDDLVLDYFNHYHADGTRLYDRPWFLELDGLPADVRICPYSSIGYQGNLIAYYYRFGEDEEMGLCILDERGNLLDERYLHPVQMSLRYSKITRLENGNFGYLNDIRFGDDRALFLLSFDPERNEFPWGEDGYMFVCDDRSKHINAEFIGQDSDGNIIVSNSAYRTTEVGFNQHLSNVYKIDPQNGNRIGDPLEIPAFSIVRFFAPSVDGGYWLGGSHIHGFWEDDPPHYLNFITSDGVPPADGSKSTGISTRAKGRVQQVLRRDNNSYGLMVMHKSRCSKQILNPFGEIVGNPDGEVLDVNNDTYRHANFVKLENSVVKVESVVDDPQNGHIEIDAYNVNCRRIWNNEINFDDEGLVTTFDPVATENGEYIVIPAVIQGHENFVLMLNIINSHNGQLAEQWEMDRIDPDGAGVINPNVFLSCKNNQIYVSFSKTRAEEALINKYNLNGESLWEGVRTIPLNVWPQDREIIGISKSRNNGVWICQYTEIPENDVIWMQFMDDEEGLTDSLSCFPDLVPRTLHNTVDLVHSNDISWIVHNSGDYADQHVMPPLQGFRDGEFVYESPGLQLQLPDGLECGDIRVIPCRNGDIYVAWHPVRNRFGDWMVTLLDSEGQFRDGWDDSGIPICDGRLRNLQDFMSFGENELACVLGGMDYRLYMQHISDHERRSVDNPQVSLADEFEIVGIHPNPFNSTTTIRYDLPVRSDISIEIYNIRGQMVDVLVNGEMSAGRHSVVWDADLIPTGVYLLKSKSGSRVFTDKLVLVR